MMMIVNILSDLRLMAVQQRNAASVLGGQPDGLCIVYLLIYM